MDFGFRINRVTNVERLKSGVELEQHVAIASAAHEVPRGVLDELLGRGVTFLGGLHLLVLRADLVLSGGPISYGNSSAAQISATIKAAKDMPPANEKKMYYADLRSQIHAEMTDVRSGELVEPTDLPGRQELARLLRL